MDKTGGAEITTRFILESLVGAGHDVTLYTNAPPKNVPRGVSVSVPDVPVPHPRPVLGCPFFAGSIFTNEGMKDSWACPMTMF